MEEEPLQQELTCCVCLEIFHKPILLDCAHNVCEEHMTVLSKPSFFGVCVTCPICRAECERPSVTEFKMNLVLSNVIEIMHQEGKLEGIKKEKAEQYLTALKVQVLEHKGPMQEMNWEFHTQDLNEKNKGKFIYVGWQKGSVNPITTIDFFCLKQKQLQPPVGWEWDPNDLNTGAKGEFIYMCWKRETTKAPIRDITFCEPFFDGLPPPIEGWNLINVDLCKGCSRITHKSPCTT